MIISSPVPSSATIGDTILELSSDEDVLPLAASGSGDVSASVEPADASAVAASEPSAARAGVSPSRLARPLLLEWSAPAAGALSTQRSRSRSASRSPVLLPVAQQDLDLAEVAGAEATGAQEEHAPVAVAVHARHAEPAAVAVAVPARLQSRLRCLRRLSRELAVATDGRVTVNFADAQSPEEQYRHCLNVVSWLQRLGSAYYIGITANPAVRWHYHAIRFDSMVLLMEAPGSHVTGALERRVLNTFLGHVRCLNVAPGGETRTPGSPHYLYVAWRRDGLIRRGTTVRSRGVL